MDGELREDLQAAGIEVLVRPLSVLRRAAMSPLGLAGIAASLARDGGGLARLARRRGVALIHTNTSVTLGGSAASRLARFPTSGTCARSTPASSASGRHTGGCC